MLGRLQRGCTQPLLGALSSEPRLRRAARLLSAPATPAGQGGLEGTVAKRAAGKVRKAVRAFGLSKASKSLH